MEKARLGFGSLFVLGALFILGGPVWAATGTVNCEPPALERTLFSKKVHTVIFTAPVPDGCEIVLKIVSPTREFTLNKSGKGLGFVWLPVRHARVKNVPGMYALLSSCKISGMLSAEGKEAMDIGLDFREIYKQAEIHHQDNPPEEEALRLNREYLSGLIEILKGRELYQQKEGAVEINGGQIRARLIHPADAPLGEYRVFCYALKDGRAQLLAENCFHVRATGVVEWLAHQAQTNGTVYGILAALIAVGVGMFVGVVFKRGRGH